MRAPPQLFDSLATVDEGGQSRFAGAFRVGEGLACTIWLERRGGAWQVAGLFVHPERDLVTLGPLNAAEWDEGGNLRVDPTATTAQLRLEAASQAPAAVTARGLRDLPIGALANRLRDMLQDGSGGSVTHPIELPSFIDRDVARRPGRRGRSDLFYAQVAAQYVNRLKGGSVTPARELAQEVGFQPTTVNNWIHESRKRGFLTSAPQGRAGGHLTARAVDLLSDGGSAGTRDDE